MTNPAKPMLTPYYGKAKNTINMASNEKMFNMKKLGIIQTNDFDICIISICGPMQNLWSQNKVKDRRCRVSSDIEDEFGSVSPSGNSVPCVHLLRGSRKDPQTTYLALVRFS
jgi:hypothetical protein